MPIDLLDALALFPRPEVFHPQLEYKVATPERLKEQLAVIAAEKQRRASLGLPQMNNSEKVLVLAEYRAKKSGEPVEQIQARLSESLRAFRP